MHASVSLYVVPGDFINSSINTTVYFTASLTPILWMDIKVMTIVQWNLSMDTFRTAKKVLIS